MRGFLSRPALALAILAAAAAAAVHRDRIDPAALDAWLGSLGAWAPVGYVVLYALATMAFVPGAIFGLAGGALFGPVWGSLWNLLGATLGATLAFLVARYIVGDWVERRAGGLLKRLIEGIHTRRLGTAQDIAHASLFFLSEQAGWITGQILSVDGGRS